MPAVQQQFPSAVHSAEVSVTSLFESVAGNTSCRISSLNLQTWKRREKQQGEEGLPVVLRVGMLSGGQGCVWWWHAQTKSHACHPHSPIFSRWEVLEQLWVMEEDFCKCPCSSLGQPSKRYWPWQGLPRVTQGSALKHPTKKNFIKKWLKEITLKKECVCPTIAGVLHGS